MFNQIMYFFNYGQGRFVEGVVFIYVQFIVVVYCFFGKNELVNICFCWCGGVGDQVQFVVFQVFGVVYVGVIDVYFVDDDIVVDIWFVKNCFGKIWFVVGNVWYCIIQVGGEGNVCMEVDFCFFQCSVGVVCGDNDFGGDQFVDYFWFNVFRGEGYFGDYIGVVVQEIDQCCVWFMYVVWIVGVFFNDIQLWFFEMQVQCLVWMFLQIFVYYVYVLFYQIVVGGNQCWQEVGVV